MKETFIDQHSPQTATAVHRLDARLKIIACAVYVLAVVTTPFPEAAKLCLYPIPCLGISLFARLPLRSLLIRSAVVLPFSAVVAMFVPFLTEGHTIASFHILWGQLRITREGIEVLVEVVSKSWLSVLGLMLLSGITRPRELIAGLRGLGVPDTLTTTLFLTTRYLTLIGQEAMQMERARRCRTFGPWHRWAIGSTGGIVASLLIRSYERAERVYQAMLARGFEGKISGRSLPPLSAGALVAFFGFVIVVISIRFWGLL